MADQEQVVVSGDNAEPVGSVASPVGATEAGVAGEPFFTYDYEDGEKFTAHNKGELADHFRHSSMRKRDYEKAMGTVQTRSQYLDEQLKRVQSQEDLATQRAGKYQQIDELMKANPAFDRYVKEQFDSFKKGGNRGTPDVSEVVNKAIAEAIKPFDEKLSGLTKAEQERAEKAGRAQAMARLQERVGKFDETLIEKEIARLSEYPPEAKEEALLDLLYHSVRGRENPAELERRAAASASKKRPPSATSTPGVNPGERDPNKMSEEERAEAALAILNRSG